MEASKVTISKTAFAHLIIMFRNFERLNDDLIKFIRLVPKKPTIYYEIKVLSRLNFHTRVPLYIVQEHMFSILNMLDKSLLDYLGEEAYQYFIKSSEEHRRNHFVKQGKIKRGHKHKHKRKRQMNRKNAKKVSLKEDNAN